MKMGQSCYSAAWTFVRFRQFKIVASIASSESNVPAERRSPSKCHKMKIFPFAPKWPNDDHGTSRMPRKCSKSLKTAAFKVDWSSSSISSVTASPWSLKTDTLFQDPELPPNYPARWKWFVWSRASWPGLQAVQKFGRAEGRVTAVLPVSVVSIKFTWMAEDVVSLIRLLDHVVYGNKVI